jgi:hypothetical protein
MPVIQRLAAGGARGFGFGVGGVVYSGLIAETATGSDAVSSTANSTYQTTITETATGSDAVSSELPTPGYASFDFNGASYFTVPSNAQFAVGTGDYIVECFVYPYAIGTSGFGSPIFDTNWLSLNNSSYGFAVTLAPTTGRLTLRQRDTSIQTTYGLSINTWYYICVSRSGGTTRLFAALASDTNTVLRGSSSTTYSMSQGGIYVGKFSNYSTYFNGLISNLRFIVGSGVSSAPAVPTTPLTNISNTKLLTCQDITVIDNSTANSGGPWTLTNNGVTTTYTNPL